MLSLTAFFVVLLALWTLNTHTTSSDTGNNFRIHWMGRKEAGVLLCLQVLGALSSHLSHFSFVGLQYLCD